MTYTLQIDNSAYKVFKKLPKSAQEKTIEKAQTLKTNPEKGNPLKGEFRFLRSLRFSFKGTSYRIIYQIQHKKSVIVVRLAETRENIYRRLKQMGVKKLER
jgi:mRNA-degrading endonuclease RelE of RelBE toxin-antitoxin system